MQNQTFFTEKEDLKAIIEKFLNSKVDTLNKISTGWTNIVFDTSSNGNSYIVRFPRNDFFSKQMEKDVEISNFVAKNLGIKTSDMTIQYHNERPFSIHKKINGNSLTNRITELNDEKKLNIAKEIANVFYRFHSFDINKLPNNFRVRFYDFLSNLPKLNEDQYDFSIFDSMLEDEETEKKIFAYGDLNIGNIILDENDNVNAFIDFAFCGISDIYTDLSRISCRMDDMFFQNILKEYEKLVGISLDLDRIENRKKMWQYIEKEYMEYMKFAFPEVKF